MLYDKLTSNKNNQTPSGNISLSRAEQVLLDNILPFIRFLVLYFVLYAAIPLASSSGSSGTHDEELKAVRERVCRVEASTLHTCTPQLSFHESITSTYLLSLLDYNLRGL